MPNTPRTSLYCKRLAPCKDCVGRYVGCHSQCEKYIEWKAENDKARNDYVKAHKGEREAECYAINKKVKYNGIRYRKQNT